MYWYKVKFLGSSNIYYFIAQSDEAALKLARHKGQIDFMLYVYADSHSCKVIRQVY